MAIAIFVSDMFYCNTFICLYECVKNEKYEFALIKKVHHNKGGVHHNKRRVHHNKGGVQGVDSPQSGERREEHRRCSTCIHLRWICLRVLNVVPLTPSTHYYMPHAMIQNKQDPCIPPQKRCVPLSGYTNHD